MSEQEVRPLPAGGTPAERLLAAAEILDKRASEATQGPWNVDGPLVVGGSRWADRFRHGHGRAGAGCRCDRAAGFYERGCPLHRHHPSRGREGGSCVAAGRGAVGCTAP